MTFRNGHIMNKEQTKPKCRCMDINSSNGIYIVNTKELWQGLFVKKYTYYYNQLADLF